MTVRTSDLGLIPMEGDIVLVQIGLTRVMQVAVMTRLRSVAVGPVQVVTRVTRCLA